MRNKQQSFVRKTAGQIRLFATAYYSLCQFHVIALAVIASAYAL